MTQQNPSNDADDQGTDRGQALEPIHQQQKSESGREQQPNPNTSARTGQRPEVDQDEVSRRSREQP
jgi:hypothetical protein